MAISPSSSGRRKQEKALTDGALEIIVKGAAASAVTDIGARVPCRLFMAFEGP